MCNPLRILLVEDNPEDAARITRLLHQLQISYLLEQAKTQTALLQALIAQVYDLYLVSGDLVQQGQPFHHLIRLQVPPDDWAPIVVLTDRCDIVQNDPVPNDLPRIHWLTKADLTVASLELIGQIAFDRCQYSHQLQVLSHKQSLLSTDLQISEERYRLGFQATCDGIWDWNLTTNEVFFSTSWHQLFGAEEIENQSEAWLERIHPEDLYWVKQEITAHLEGLTARFESEHRMQHQDGCYRWMWVRGQAVRNGDHQATRFIGVHTDITNLKRAEETLVHNALYDTLTGLPNRVSLMERLHHAGNLTSHRKDYLFAVLSIDIDRFKMINDSLGHTLGNELLKSISARLATCLRPHDTIARLGGDEFVVLLEDIKTNENVIWIAKRILQELSAPFNLEGREIFTSASIGITFSSIGFDHPEDLLRDADLAMYRAKSQGRGRYELFHPQMHRVAVAQLQIETDLRRAIERQELQLHYQPIISLRTNRLVGFEALIRWQHPQQGLISPAQFVPIAEETGLILPIGRWILQTACTQMRQWQKQFPDWSDLSINVNLSGKQFTPYLVEQVRKTLAESELEAQYLKLEITESVLMGYAESAIATLAELKQLGAHLAIDDFGTGYSSLSYLHRFPIDTLKVDRSFIQRVDTDGEQLAIVRTLITLAWNLGMEIVAEGVETPKQLSQLRSLRCEYAQGFLFSQPQDAKAIETLLAQKISSGQMSPFA